MRIIIIIIECSFSVSCMSTALHFYLYVFTYEFIHVRNICLRNIYITGPFYPTLKLLHKYPTMMHKIQVDKGAIRFILGGANIMCPGITSNGGKICESLDAEEPVAIYAEVQINNP